MPTHPNIGLNEILQRSAALDEGIIRLIDPDTYQVFDASARISASFSACCISMEHARSLRLLIHEELPTSAIGLMRLQYEALVRSVWLFYAAPEAVAEKLNATLTADTEKAASKLPMLSEMLQALAGKAPAPAVQGLNQFKATSAGALHSFVHASIHPLKRHLDGYPLPLLIQIIRNSNGLFTMSGMMFAILSGNTNLMQRMGSIQPAFSDCLPELLSPAVS